MTDQLHTCLRLAVLTAAAVLLTDLASKALVLALEPGWVDPHYLTLPPLSFAVLGAAGTLALALAPSRILAVAFGLCLGGAGGNLSQRAVGVPVTDWIAVGGYVWDLADVALLGGVLVALVSVVKAKESR